MSSKLAMQSDEEEDASTTPSKSVKKDVKVKVKEVKTKPKFKSSPPPSPTSSDSESDDKDHSEPTQKKKPTNKPPPSSTKKRKAPPHKSDTEKEDSSDADVSETDKSSPEESDTDAPSKGSLKSKKGEGGDQIMSLMGGRSKKNNIDEVLMSDEDDDNSNKSNSDEEGTAFSSSMEESAEDDDGDNSSSVLSVTTVHSLSPKASVKKKSTTTTGTNKEVKKDSSTSSKSNKKSKIVVSDTAVDNIPAFSSSIQVVSSSSISDKDTKLTKGTTKKSKEKEEMDASSIPPPVTKKPTKAQELNASVEEAMKVTQLTAQKSPAPSHVTMKSKEQSMPTIYDARADVIQALQTQKDKSSGGGGHGFGSFNRPSGTIPPPIQTTSPSLSTSLPVIEDLAFQHYRPTSPSYAPPGSPSYSPPLTDLAALNGSPMTLSPMVTTNLRLDTGGSSAGLQPQLPFRGGPVAPSPSPPRTNGGGNFYPLPQMMPLQRNGSTIEQNGYYPPMSARNQPPMMISQGNVSGGPVSNVVIHGKPVSGLLVPKRSKRTLDMKTPAQQRILPLVWPYVTFINVHGEFEQIMKDSQPIPLTPEVLEYGINGKWFATVKVKGQSCEVVLTPERTGIVLKGVGGRSSDNVCIEMPTMLKPGSLSCWVAAEFKKYPRTDLQDGKLRYRYVVYYHRVRVIAEKLNSNPHVDKWHRNLIGSDYFLGGNPGSKFTRLKQWMATSFLSEHANVEDEHGNVFEFRSKSITEISHEGLQLAIKDSKEIENDGYIFISPSHDVAYKLKEEGTVDFIVTHPTTPSKKLTIPKTESKILESLFCETEEANHALPFFPYFAEELYISKQPDQVPCYLSHSVKGYQYRGMAQVTSWELHAQIQECLTEPKRDGKLVVEINPRNKDCDFDTIVQVREDKIDGNTHGSAYSTIKSMVHPLTIGDVLKKFKIHPPK